MPAGRESVWKRAAWIGGDRRKQSRLGRRQAALRSGDQRFGGLSRCQRIRPLAGGPADGPEQEAIYRIPSVAARLRWPGNPYHPANDAANYTPGRAHDCPDDRPDHPALNLAHLEEINREGAMTRRNREEIREERFARIEATSDSSRELYFPFSDPKPSRFLGVLAASGLVFS